MKTWKTKISWPGITTHFLTAVILSSGCFYNQKTHATSLTVIDEVLRSLNVEPSRASGINRYRGGGNALSIIDHLIKKLQPPTPYLITLNNRAVALENQLTLYGFSRDDRIHLLKFIIPWLKPGVAGSTDGFTMQDRYQGALQNIVRTSRLRNQNITLLGVGAHMLIEPDANLVNKINIRTISPQIEEVISSINFTNIPKTAIVDLRIIELDKDFLQFAIFKAKRLMAQKNLQDKIRLHPHHMDLVSYFQQSNLRESDLIIATNVLYYAYRMQGIRKLLSFESPLDLEEYLTDTKRFDIANPSVTFNRDIIKRLLSHVSIFGKLVIDPPTINPAFYFVAKKAQEESFFSEYDDQHKQLFSETYDLLSVMGFSRSLETAKTSLFGGIFQDLGRPIHIVPSTSQINYKEIMLYYLQPKS